MASKNISEAVARHRAAEGRRASRTPEMTGRERQGNDQERGCSGYLESLRTWHEHVQEQHEQHAGSHDKPGLTHPQSAASKLEWSLRAVGSSAASQRLKDFRWAV